MNMIIEPFTGIGKYKLYQSLDSTKDMLSSDGISYETEILDNTECIVPEPWTILRTSIGMNMVFAKDKLWEINVKEPFDGELTNGIRLKMDFKKAQSIDPKLEFDEWEEFWRSPDGYWIEDDIETKTVLAITIFIKEVLDNDLFDKYEW